MSRSGGGCLGRSVTLGWAAELASVVFALVHYISAPANTLLPFRQGANGDASALSAFHSVQQPNTLLPFPQGANGDASAPSAFHSVQPHQHPSPISARSQRRRLGAFRIPFYAATPRQRLPGRPGRDIPADVGVVWGKVVGQRKAPVASVGRLVE